jgi:menaquinone-dependent protoporphyrinogen IX oxidase
MPVPSDEKAGGAARRPRVLFLYYSFTHQAEKATEVMSAALTERGCDVDQAEIEFTDERWRDHFSKFPFANGFLGVVRMLPAQMRKATGDIRVPDEATSGDYDLVVIGSPTWWLTTSIPVRSFLKSDDADALLGGTRFTSFVVCRRYYGFNLRTVKKLGTKHGGEWVDGTEFTYRGGQIRSLLSLISYLGSGEQRERYLGVKIPPTNLQAENLDAAREYADKLADTLVAPEPASASA